jgi:O-antigen ligase
MLPSGIQAQMLDGIIFALILLTTVTIIFSIAIVQILLGLLAVAWICKIILTKDYRYKRTLLDIPYAAFLLARVASVLLSSDLQRSVPTLWTEIPFYFLFFILTHELDITNAKQVRILLKSLFVAAFVAAIIGASKYLLGMQHRASSTTSGYYTLGNYLLLVLAVVLFVGKTKELLANRVAWACLSLVLAGGILFTFNRLHWAAMAILFAAVGALKERLLLVVFVVAAGTFIVLSPSGAQRFSDLLNVVSRSSDRDVIWRGALMIGDQHPVFGYGPRTFDAIFPLKSELTDKGVGSWHNDYVQVYMESGAVGLLALLGLLGATFTFGILALRSASLPPHLRELLAALLVALAVIAAVGGMLDVLNSLLFRIFLALVALIASAYQPKKISTSIQ